MGKFNLISMEKTLKGAAKKIKVAIVTGGTRGIGLGISKNLLGRGYKVAVCCRGEKELSEGVKNLENFVSELKKGGTVGNSVVNRRSVSVNGESISGLDESSSANDLVFGVLCDVSKEEDWAKMISDVIKKWGRIDVLANNAGILLQKDILSTSVSEMQNVLNVNFMGAFNGMRVVVPIMKKQGGGRIVNTASIAGLKGYAYLSAYCASKFAIIGLTRTAAQEFAPFGIRVNAVCPGLIETLMTADMRADKSQNEALISDIPMHRVGKPDEVGEVVGFLADEESSFVTGSAYVVDGGFMS